MGFLGRRLGRGTIKISGAVMLNGGREVEVVGESHYQHALERAAGGRQRDVVCPAFGGVG